MSTRPLGKWAGGQPTSEQILDAILRVGDQVSALSLRFDALLANLAEDEDPDPTTLDGQPVRERDQSQPL